MQTLEEQTEFYNNQKKLFQEFGSSVPWDNDLKSMEEFTHFLSNQLLYHIKKEPDITLGDDKEPIVEAV